MSKCDHQSIGGFQGHDPALERPTLSYSPRHDQGKSGHEPLRDLFLTFSFFIPCFLAWVVRTRGCAVIKRAQHCPKFSLDSRFSFDRSIRGEMFSFSDSLDVSLQVLSLCVSFAAAHQRVSYVCTSRRTSRRFIFVPRSHYTHYIASRLLVV